MTKFLTAPFLPTSEMAALCSKTSQLGSLVGGLSVIPVKSVTAPRSRQECETRRRAAVSRRRCRASGNVGTDAPEDFASNVPGAAVRRREALAALSALVSSSLMANISTSSARADEVGFMNAESEIDSSVFLQKKNVIITGSNSGIGFNAAIKLAAQGYNVFLGCRSIAKARLAESDLRRELAQRGVDPAAVGAIVPLEIDLADLSSIRKFVGDWRAVVGPDAGLDSLCLNAGVQFSGGSAIPKRTANGFEITVGVNHLGHFLLANLMVPDLEKAAKQRGHARVVVTASEVHDPASQGGSVGNGATLGDLSGLAAGRQFGMVDGKPYDPDKAYKDSKLCNILFARELQRRLAARGSGVTVNAFGPGLITRTGFFRSQNPVFVKLFDFATNEIFHVAETVEGGGDCLAYMVTNPELEGKGSLYYNNDIVFPGGHKFHEDQPSKEAMNDEEAKKLWELSAKLVDVETI